MTLVKKLSSLGLDYPGAGWLEGGGLHSPGSVYWKLETCDSDNPLHLLPNIHKTEVLLFIQLDYISHNVHSLY